MNIHRAPHTNSAMKNTIENTTSVMHAACNVDAPHIVNFRMEKRRSRPILLLSLRSHSKRTAVVYKNI